VQTQQPANCKWRVEHQRGNPSERGIPLSYYEGIDDIHFSIFLELLSKNLAKVVILNWGDFHDAEQVHNRLSSVLSGQSPTGSLVFVDQVHPEGSSNHGSLIVYSTPEDIEKAYNELKEQKDPVIIGGDASNIVRVYIPSDIMQISPEEKGVTLHDYPIRFFRNEYKRVVLWHLSKAHHVTMYKSKAL
jgi:hypothetical protein